MFGRSFNRFMNELEEKNLLERDNGTIALTRRGLLEVDHFLLGIF